jgi:hypothetical protein
MLKLQNFPSTNKPIFAKKYYAGCGNIKCGAKRGNPHEANQ